jgi:hypothetical protein
MAVSSIDACRKVELPGLICGDVVGVAELTLKHPAGAEIETHIISRRVCYARLDRPWAPEQYLRWREDQAIP